MTPSFLLPEVEIRASGTGPALDLGERRPDSILITLEITRIVEQQSLDVSIQGSADGHEWLAKPLAAFSQKFYCGTYQVLLNLALQTSNRFLRVKWAANRWGKGELKPLFGFYVFAQESVPAGELRVMAGTAA